MDDIGTLVQTAGGVAGTVKTIADAISSLRGQGKDKEAEKRLSDTLDLVMDLRSRVFDLQEKALSLQQKLADLQGENMQLREQIRAKEEGSADRENYERCNVGKSVVVVRKDNPNMYLCATCFEKGDKVYLSKQPDISRRITGISHTCPKCSSLVHA